MDGHVGRRGLTIVLQEVDSGRIKSFLRAHRSFERKNLQDWLNLFCFFWNTPGTNERKAVILTDKVVSERQIIRYRGKKKLSSSEKRKNA